MRIAYTQSILFLPGCAHLSALGTLVPRAAIPLRTCHIQHPNPSVCHPLPRTARDTARADSYSPITMTSPYAGLTRSSLRPIEEDETHYLTLDLGAVDPSLLAHCPSIRLIGLETPTPFLQFGDLVFQGIHTHTLGTELVLDTRGVIAQSEHKVLFNPVQLIPKAETETAAEPGPDPQSHDPAGPAPKRRGRGRGHGRGRARAKKRAGDSS
ncbi:unnamed protein product [Rhizoctonia solani]|uniref:Transcription factor TFIIIC triple barrel domain-containing protein n=1 Tax=Rhizoctonia solani TaxID=456999 RepID=A0A8H3AQP3_9AGAM|nr:unnamed protein product [Rhizoctonia solani]